MGLSNEERLSHVWASIHELIEVREIRKELPDVLAQIDEVVYTSRSRVANGAYWLLGGDLAAQQRYCDPSSPAGEALESSAMHLRNRHRYEDDHLDISRCVQQFPRLQVAFETYSHTESYFYAANRYTDDLSERLIPLSREMGKLQMLCAGYMRSNTEYVTCWAAHKLGDYLIRHWPENDTIVKLWNEGLIWHSMNLRKLTDTEVSELLHILAKLKNCNHRSLTTQQRLGITLKLTWRRIAKERYNCRELINTVSEHNRTHPNDPICIQELNEILDDYKSQLLEETEKPDRWYYCSVLDDLNITYI